jgi:multidrug transporter EmrE-like cation transporter
MNQWLSWCFLVLASCLLCGGNLCIKQAKLQGDEMLSPMFLTGIAIFAGNMFFYSKALETLPLSTAYPIFASLGFLLIAITSLLIFQESFSWKQWSGLALILSGLAMIVAGKNA